MSINIALKMHVTLLIEKFSARFRATLSLLMFKQLSAGLTAYAHSKVITAQPQAVTVGLPCLQGQGSKAQRDGETRSNFWLT